MSVPANFKGFTKRSKGVVWLVPATLTSGVITAIGTPKIITSVVDIKNGFPKSASASKSETFTLQLGTGITVSADKVTTTVDPSTGNEVSTASGSDGYTVSVTYADTGKTMEKYMTDSIGDLYVVCWPSREAVDPTEEGFKFLLAELSSYTGPEDAAETWGKASIEFTGGKAYTADSATTTALAALNLAAATADGKAVSVTVDPPALTSPYVTEILTGKTLIV